MTEIVLEGKDSYSVLRRIGENEKFSLYLVNASSRPDQEMILKIGKAVAQNGLLDREAFLLSEMKERSDALEKEYAHISVGGGTLNYHIGFPELVETFLAEEQGSRRVLVTTFAGSNHIGDFVPLSMVRSRDLVRVDPKTSAWILGKLLKINVFTNSMGIEIGNLEDENLLIERVNHLVTIFDWSFAVRHAEGVPRSVARGEIQSVTREVIRLLDGNAVTGKIPADDQLSDDLYQEMLLGLLGGTFSNPEQAHKEFYAVVEALWGRKFHPFTSYPLNEEGV